MKKIIKSALIILSITIVNFTMFANTAQAVSQQAQVYTKGEFERIISFNGVPVKTTHAVYSENGKEYPAYCLNVHLDGVGDKIQSYITSNQGKITDIGLWRVIVNGYPYRSTVELGTSSEAEAYIATKQAIYCYLYNRTADGYAGLNPAGDRAVYALRKILNDANASTETLEVQETKILRR